MTETMIMQEASKQFRYGTHRSRDPRQTFEKISRYFDAVGLTRIADVTGLDSIGIPVLVAIRPNSKSLVVSQGKGMTTDLARVSAAMESIELFHAENVSLPVFRGSYRSLAGGSMVSDPLTLNLDPLSVYHPDLVVNWVSGMEVNSGREVLVPLDLVHCTFLHEPVHQPVFLMSSNGLASGNTRSEALSHAICEVIERDASMMWEVVNANADADMGAVDLDGIDSEPIQLIVEKLRRAGVTPYLWDQTSDIGLPVFGCAIVEHHPQRSEGMIGPFTGFGCHLSKEVAALRALTEAVQSRLTYITGSRDDIYRGDYAKLGSRATLQRIQQAEATVDYNSIPSLETDTFEGDIQVQLEHLMKAGLDKVYFVDLSIAEIGIPVVRALIPGTSFAAYHKGRQVPLNEQTKRRLMKRVIVRDLMRKAQ